MRDLNWLLSPHCAEWFYANVWQKKEALIATGRPAFFADFFSKQAVELILEYAQPKPPSLRIVASALDQSVDIPYSSNGRINLDQLRKIYLTGHTIVLNAVEDFDPNVAQLARTIETQMGARVQVNAYLTPPSAQGFRAHYDTHDVLVAQIEGAKRWKVYGADSVCPLDKLANGDPRPWHSAEPPQEHSLVSGDILYIPRGWVHEAMTEDIASLHLTFGIHPPLAKDLLQAALDTLERRLPELRAAMPVGTLCSAERREHLETQFAELLTLFTTQASLQEAAAAIDDQLLRRGRSAGDGHLFNDAEKLSTISDDTRLERRCNLPCRVVPIDDGVGLQFLNGLVKGSAAFEPAMQFVANQTTPFAVNDLPGLPSEHRVIFASSLVADGLCRFVPRSRDVSA